MSKYGWGLPAEQLTAEQRAARAAKGARGNRCGYGTPEAELTPEHKARRALRAASRSAKRRAAREKLDPASPQPPGALLDFATPADLELIETGTGREAAAALARTKATAARRGWAPSYGWSHAVPTPHVAKGVSTMRRIKLPDGSEGIQWVKSSLDEKRYQETIARAVAELARPLRVVEHSAVSPEHADSDLLNVYLIGDAHFGMFAWSAETLGRDYDLEIAESLHARAIHRLVQDSPPAAQALVIQLGDLTHADNYDYLTQSGHRLDADSRYPKMIDVAIRALKQVGDACLRRHRELHWQDVPGNHDKNSAPWLSRVLHEYWASCGRVDVDLSPAPHRKFEFGNTLLGSTHGDTARGKFTARRPFTAPDFLHMMATDWREAWGRTRFHMGVQGHIHSSNRIEAAGGSLESFQNLASNDAWHAAARWRSGQSMSRITLHKTFGEIGRGRCPVEMIE